MFGKKQKSVARERNLPVAPAAHRQKVIVGFFKGHLQKSRNGRPYGTRLKRSYKEFHYEYMTFDTVYSVEVPIANATNFKKKKYIIKENIEITEDNYCKSTEVGKDDFYVYYDVTISIDNREKVDILLIPHDDNLRAVVTKVYDPESTLERGTVIECPFNFELETIIE